MASAQELRDEPCALCGDFEADHFANHEIRTALVEQGARRDGAYCEWREETDELGARLREAKDAGISITEAAKLAGVSRFTVYELLKGDKGK